MDEPQAQAGEPKQSAQKQATGLKGLVSAKFGTLSAAESLMLDKAVNGEMAVCGPNNDDEDERNDPKKADDWTPQRHIRAELVAWLCANEPARKQVHPRGVQVYGADITGPLDLSFVNIPFQLMLRHCRLTQDINLRRAEVSELDLQGSSVKRIMADRLIVKSYVFLKNGFAAEGEVWLLGAQIGGDLDCVGGTFTNEGGGGESTSRAAFSSMASPPPAMRCRAPNRWKSQCDGGIFTNPSRKDTAGKDRGSGYALNADGINVKGAAFLRNGFAATGEVELIGAQIGGNLECDAGTFTNEAIMRSTPPEPSSRDRFSSAKARMRRERKLLSAPRER